MFDVLQKPVISEKATKLAERGTYLFVVSSRANKIMVARGVTERYGVDVCSVRVMRMPAKRVRRGKQSGWKSGYKKAFVTLRKGQTIELA